jgi:hypothetical protein
MQSNRPKVTVCLVALLTSSLLLQACKTENATVMCGGLGRADSDLGVLNLAQLAIGAVIDLNPATKRANQLTVVQPPQGAVIAPNPSVDATSLVKSSKLTVNVSADVPSTVKAQLETTVSANTEFDMKNSVRKQWPDALTGVNNNGNALALLKGTEGHIILVVQGLVYADDLSIKLAKSVSSSASANIVKIGNFTFNLTYDCNSSLHQQAQKGAALLWKATQAKYDPTTGKLVPDSTAFNLNDYDFTLTFQ